MLDCQYYKSIMLRSLFSKLKSEKSVASAAKEEKEKIGNDGTGEKEKETLRVYPDLKEGIQIVSEIRKIRYQVFQQHPNLYVKVLSCPISHFNQLPYAKRKVKEIDLRKNPLPSYIDALKPLLAKELPNFNHILVNVYPSGVGIMPHFDGPLYTPKVVVLSLGGPSIISFTDNYTNTNKLAKLFLEDNSIHIFQGEAYQNCLHGIENYSIDSVFLNIRQDEDQLIGISKASVDNFHLTKLNKVVLQYLRQNTQQFLKKAQQIDLTSQYGSQCFLLKIEDNSEYNYKVEIVRQERISITIRQMIDSQQQ